MRNRSMALVVRNDKILMIKTFRFNRYIWKLPGGGLRIGETAGKSCYKGIERRMWFRRVINRPLNTLHCKEEV